jgi:hypothetical protein
MGVRYARDYSNIIKELASALSSLEGAPDFFGMDPEDWSLLDADDRFELFKTAADDIFYALGLEASVSIGCGRVEYDEVNHILKVIDAVKISIINLV